MVALIAVTVGALAWYRYKRKSESQSQTQSVSLQEMDESTSVSKQKAEEMDGSHGVSELGKPLLHEAPDSGMVYEAFSQHIVHELPDQSQTSVGVR